MKYRMVMDVAQVSLLTLEREFSQPDVESAIHVFLSGVAAVVKSNRLDSAWLLEKDSKRVVCIIALNPVFPDPPPWLVL